MDVTEIVFGGIAFVAAVGLIYLFKRALNKEIDKFK